MTTLDHAGTAGPDPLAASGRFPAGPPAPFAPPEQGPARQMEVTTLGGTIAPSELTSFSDAGDSVVRLLLTGAYPVLTWMPFLLAGMAIGRLDPVRSAGRLIAGGLVGAVLGYGGSWLAVDVLGGRQALLDAVAPVAGKLGWRSLVGRGPLDALLHAASARAGGSR